MMAKLGIYSILAGFFVGVFSGISNFMKARNFWVDLTISKLIGEDTSEAVVAFINIIMVKNLLYVLIYEVPGYAVLFGLGVVFFIISLFVKTH